MTLLLRDPQIAARRAAVRGPLQPLYASLAADLRAVIASGARPDPRKARMTRVGGRCPRDGALLAFDPFDAHRHRCPLCGGVYEDEAHEQWWRMWHHLWLAERVVHAAVLHLCDPEPAFADFARGVLGGWADRYLDYPNRDNVLGPSRPFFSTYLESIWLLQICVALDALEAADGAAMHGLGGRVRERIVVPSRALVAGYPEPGSNRQVWNAAAQLAASRLLGDAAGAERALDGPVGVIAQLRDGLLADGSWYEGENYHQFAHRGLWYGVTLAESAGMPVDDALLGRFAEGFASPFLVALPDLTLPSRRDAQYAISLRQWRYAESCELGLARGDDPRLAAALARLYDDALPRRDTGRWCSAAESERNAPPSALGRADLGWRALLHARPERPAATSWAPGTVHLPAQGLAVLRRDAGRLWVGLDYGHSGGGHGHPDRLNLLVFDGQTRWLDDVGTGSYVERALHWYRSTLAHQAPLVDGASQPRADGMLLGIAPGAPLGGVSAAARLAPGVVGVRTVVVDEVSVIDRVAWRAPHDATVDLPFHLDGEATLADGRPVRWAPAARPGAGGLEDGFDFLTDVEAASVLAGPVVRLALTAPGDAIAEGAACWLLPSGAAQLWRATAPGAPGAGRRRFHVVRMSGRTGHVLTVLDPRGGLASVERVGDDAVALVAADGVRTVHRPAGAGWRVEHGAREIGLALPTTIPPEEAFPLPVEVSRIGAQETVVLDGDEPWSRTLGEADYRRSEDTWREAGGPTAIVSLRATDRALDVEVAVRLGRPTTFVAAGTENPLDNERAEVNGDGVQLHVGPTAAADAPLAGWLLVPDGFGGVRTVATTAAAAGIPLSATASRLDDGYRLAISLPRAALAGRVLLDVLVNEMPAGRERRRGQLVLSGARGGFVYLQGDRHEASRCLVVVLPPLARP